jgi:hypothetical protein
VTEDNLADFRRRHWPRACFPPGTSEDEIYRYVLWHYINIKRARWAAERAALRPAISLRLAVRVRWCSLALRTVWRILRLMLIVDGSWPTRATAVRRIRRLRGRLAY